MDRKNSRAASLGALPSGSILTPRTVAALGLDAQDLSAAHRAGRLTRLRRGTYAQAEGLDPAQQHRIRVRAAAEVIDSSSVVSHVSAAIWHGLDVPWAMVDDVVHVTRGSRGGSIRPRLATHTGGVPDDQWTLVEGLKVTTVARTVVDLARTAEVRHAVALADHALRHRGGDILRAEMEAVLVGSVRRRGVRQAHWVVGFADPRAESGGESVSRVVLESLGLPTPVLQLEVRSAQGEFIGRSDFGWPAHRTLGEFDGRLKYAGREVPNGEDPGKVVFREKRREDRLRAAGWEVVRWVWDDLNQPDLLAASLREAFSRGRGR